jgi:hypothetical protein
MTQCDYARFAVIKRASRFPANAPTRQRATQPQPSCTVQPDRPIAGLARERLCVLGSMVAYVRYEMARRTWTGGPCPPTPLSCASLTVQKGVARSGVEAASPCPQS